MSKKNVVVQEAQVVEETKEAPVEAAAPMEAPAEPANLMVTVKPNLLDKMQAKDYERRLKKAQKKADKEAKKAAEAAEPKKDLKDKVLKGAGIAALAVTAVGGFVLFGRDKSDTVELSDGDCTASDAPAELPAVTLTESMDIPEPATETAAE